MSAADELREDLDAIVDDTTQSIAAIIGLPCADDPANHLRLLALLRDATSRALDEAFDTATDLGYTTREIEALLTRPQEWE